MRNIIGVALIVLTLAGCAGATLPEDSAFSRGLWKDNEHKTPG